MDYGFNNYVVHRLLERGQVVTATRVANHDADDHGTLDIVAKEGVQDIFRKDDIYKIEKTIEWYYTDENNQLLLEAPIMKNQLIGKVIYKLNNQVVAEMDLIAARDIMKKKDHYGHYNTRNNSKEQQGNNENTQLYYLAGAAGVVILLPVCPDFHIQAQKSKTIRILPKIPVNILNTRLYLRQKENITFHKRRTNLITTVFSVQENADILLLFYKLI